MDHPVQQDGVSFLRDHADDKLFQAAGVELSAQGRIRVNGDLCYVHFVGREVVLSGAAGSAVLKEQDATRMAETKIPTHPKNKKHKN